MHAKKSLSLILARKSNTAPISIRTFFLVVSISGMFIAAFAIQRQRYWRMMKASSYIDEVFSEAGIRYSGVQWIEQPRRWEKVTTPFSFMPMDALPEERAVSWKTRYLHLSFVSEDLTSKVMSSIDIPEVVGLDFYRCTFQWSPDFTLPKHLRYFIAEDISPADLDRLLELLKRTEVDWLSVDCKEFSTTHFQRIVALSNLRVLQVNPGWDLPADFDLSSQQIEALRGLRRLEHISLGSAVSAIAEIRDRADK